MNNSPIVIVISDGQKAPIEIISEIRKIPIEEDRIEFDHSNLIGYKYHLITKYYETDILFIPFDKPLAEFPHHLQIFVEGLFIYFDANNREFIKAIANYGQYMESNELELGILLCNELFDSEKDGITYKEARETCNLLDVIELGRTKDPADKEKLDENDDHHDPIGYDELLQVLKSFLWSNVQLNGAQNNPNEEYKHFSANNNDGKFDNTEEGDELSEQTIEAELAGFEKLLTEVMMFKSNASTWSRNERLAYTQNFADVFDDIINDGGGPCSFSGRGRAMDNPNDSSDDEDQLQPSAASPD